MGDFLKEQPRQKQPASPGFTLPVSALKSLLYPCLCAFDFDLGRLSKPQGPFMEGADLGSPSNR